MISRKISRRVRLASRCPHLVKSGLSYCNANKTPYNPSHFQLKEYCATKTHSKCPFLG
ncbi:MAG: hypothetical protein LLF86_05955 [Nitrospiraceae bacterium]|nr:hypothetical protein [Nitrospiraceae bacterium]